MAVRLPLPLKKAPNPVDQHVGSRVRMRRQMLAMSQQKLGDALGLTFQQVQKYERGANRMGASRLQQISQTLQVPVEFFFEGAPNASAPHGSDGSALSMAQINDFISDSDGLRLIRAFMRIDTAALRRRIVMLVQEIAVLCPAIVSEALTTGEAKVPLLTPVPPTKLTEVGVMVTRKLPEKWSRPKRQSAQSRRRVSRETCGQVGRISDRPGYSSGCEARNLNASNAGAAHGSPSSRSGRLRCGRRNDEGGRRLAGQTRRVRGATRRPGQALIGRASKRSPIRIRVVVIRASGYVDGGMGKPRGILKT
jgi:transcriptional regulator with XRE-family HTH domain